VSNFHVGQKVVCINAEPDNGGEWCSGEGPTFGAVYTVKAIWADVDIGEVVVDFVELERAARTTAFYGCIKGYRVSRFRPVALPPQSLESDLHLFTPWLKVGEEA
jgi:hypothetical protein